MIDNAAFLDEKMEDLLVTLPIWRDYIFGKASATKKARGIVEDRTEQQALWYHDYLIDLLEQIEYLKRQMRSLG